MDDFDYGDDQDDQQRIEEKKRQMEQDANRLNTARLVWSYFYDHVSYDQVTKAIVVYVACIANAAEIFY